MRDDGSDPVSVGGRERPVTGASAQWALSPLDYCAHAVNDPHNGPPGVMVAGRSYPTPHGLPASNRIWPWLQSGER